jgi:Asp-tRNA(Asn)/Glu-tRNA(Gln) amidotransferase C subunit
MRAMPSVFSAEDVRRLARLCSIDLEDHEVEALRADLEQIVAHVRRVEASAPSSDAVASSTSFEGVAALRPDAPTPSTLDADTEHLTRGSLLELPGPPRP